MGTVAKEANEDLRLIWVLIPTLPTLFLRNNSSMWIETVRAIIMLVFWPAVVVHGTGIPMIHLALTRLLYCQLCSKILILTLYQFLILQSPCSHRRRSL